MQMECTYHDVDSYDMAYMEDPTISTKVSPERE